jgi:hypothetical protein
MFPQTGITVDIFPQALEEVLMEVLQGINELKGGKKKVVKTDATGEESNELP